jgi:hypothetical protein
LAPKWLLCVLVVSCGGVFGQINTSGSAMVDLYPMSMRERLKWLVGRDD